MSAQSQPQVGDEWEVRVPGKRMKRKRVGRVDWAWIGQPQVKMPYVYWYRLNKGREARGEAWLVMVNAQRAKLGKGPMDKEDIPLSI